MDMKIEVLSPAGDMERLEMALLYGADAVYLAGKQFGMRAAAGNFGMEELKKAVGMCHEKGVRVYVTCNTVPRNAELNALPGFLEGIADAGADAVIVTDLGVMDMAKRYAPKLDIHISTQAGVMNSASARAFWDLGAKRVVLARELTLEEIAEIRAAVPKELEIEAFVHGAMCVSFSGRCMLSSYLTGRDGNRGECAQPCRWKYSLVEEKRPGEYYEIVEDGGTYILNSRDMCMIDHVPELMAAGVTSMKIEGRMKSAYYAAVVTNAYRHAADCAMRGEKLPEVWRREVEKVSHREYSTGFYFSKDGPGQYYSDGMYVSSADVVAVVEDCLSDGAAELTQRNRFFRGDTLELLPPSGEPTEFTADAPTDTEGNLLDVLPHPMMRFKMKLPVYSPRGSVVRKAKTVDKG